MRRKIAPLLTAMVHEYAQHRELDLHGKTWSDAEHELRALLAVARGAEKVRRYVQESGYAGLEGPEDAAMFRALARLDRVSGLRSTVERNRKPSANSSRPQRAGRGR